jgi:hypothetical protein
MELNWFWGMGNPRWRCCHPTAEGQGQGEDECNRQTHSLVPLGATIDPLVRTVPLSPRHLLLGHPQPCALGTKFPTRLWRAHPQTIAAQRWFHRRSSTMQLNDEATNVLRPLCLPESLGTLHSVPFFCWHFKVTRHAWYSGVTLEDDMSEIPSAKHM